MARAKARHGRIAASEASAIVDILVSDGIARWHSVFQELLQAELGASDFERLVAISIPWLRAGSDNEMTSAAWQTLFPRVVRLASRTAVEEMVRIAPRFINDISLTNWARIWVDLSVYAKRQSGKANPLERLLVETAFRWLQSPSHMRKGDWIGICMYASNLGLHEHPLFTQMLFTALPLAPTSSLLIGAQLALRHARADGSFTIVVDAMERWFSRPTDDAANTTSWLKLDRELIGRMNINPSSTLDQVRKALDRHRPAGVDRWEAIRQLYQEGKPVEGRVVKTTSIRKKREGFVVDIGLIAFLPLEEAGLRFAQSRRDLIGRSCEFAITRVDERFFQVDISRRRLLRVRQKQWYSRVTEGDIVDAIVRQVSNSTADVEIGEVDARLLFDDRQDVVEPGDRVRATIVKIDRETGDVLLNLTQKSLEV